ncbi:MAG: hypothetical protein FWC27_11865 [Firmicutes bacterium]|nr:hypothetical protein [Bacillota bacterium]
MKTWHSKATAALECLIEDYFDLNHTEDDSKPGISTYDLVRLHHRMQGLAFTVSDYLFEMGNAIKVLEDEAIAALRLARPAPSPAGVST